MKTKVCSLCKKRKPIEKFYNFRNSKDGKQCRCKVCDGITRSKYQHKYKDRLSRLSRNRNLKARFGITLQEYDEILKSQKGRCAICSSKAPKTTSNNVRSFSVDHDHKTGKIRGLLCSKCNRGLGMFNDSLTLLNKAVRYLEIH